MRLRRAAPLLASLTVRSAWAWATSSPTAFARFVSVALGGLAALRRRAPTRCGRLRRPVPACFASLIVRHASGSGNLIPYCFRSLSLCCPRVLSTPALINSHPCNSCSFAHFVRSSQRVGSAGLMPPCVGQAGFSQPRPFGPTNYSPHALQSR